MAWLDWFKGKKNTVAAAQRLPSHRAESSGAKSGHSSPGGNSSSQAQPAAVASAQRLGQRRAERNAKRELLFQVVRECMVRVGVLSSAFKFKVLSLDQRGRSFLVMIELSSEFSGEAEKLAEVEAMIAHSAKHRHELIVQAVYWRYFNAQQVATAGLSSSTGAASAPAPLLRTASAPSSRPAPLLGADALAPKRAEATAAASAAMAHNDQLGVTNSIPIIGATSAQISASRQSIAPSATASGGDELSEDEVAAFRRALAAGASQGAMAASSLSFSTPPPASPATPAPVKSGSSAATLEAARNKLLLTGYEDTEMADDDPMPALSGTQYGELR